MLFCGTTPLSNDGVTVTEDFIVREALRSDKKDSFSSKDSNQAAQGRRL